MQLTVIFGERVFSIEVSPELRLDTLLPLIQIEGSIQGTPEQFGLALNGKTVECAGNRTVEDAGIKNGDALVVFRNVVPKRRSRSASSGSGLRRASQPPLRTNEIMLRRNLEAAMEDMPEVFVPVDMLFVSLRLNGKEIVAFVDTGAQVSILSEEAARRCELMDLIDPNFKVTAQGVGGATDALGRIMRCEMGVGDHTLLCSLVVLPGKGTGVDFILGLDILLKHKAVVDLANRAIIFNGEVSVPLLSDAEAAKHKVFGVKSEPLFASLTK